MWAAAPDPTIGFDHIIVDEAQDVRPLEWRLLKQLNSKGSWTILGDLNQRRSDWSYASWNDIARDAEISETPEDFEPEQFTLGFRSTKQIMSYANKLLPRQERHSDNIQTEGAKPTILKSSKRDLLDKSIHAAASRQESHPDGTTAIITTLAQDLLTTMQKAGWVRDKDDKRKFTKDATAIFLLTPTSARGLEFDSVVVVEPGLFPQNVGRHGALYTSLTRANQHLTVIHADPLPDPLRRR
jgi:DNA helicase IV